MNKLNHNSNIGNTHRYIKKFSYCAIALSSEEEDAVYLEESTKNHYFPLEDFSEFGNNVQLAENQILPPEQRVFIEESTIPAPQQRVFIEEIPILPPKQNVIFKENPILSPKRNITRELNNKHEHVHKHHHHHHHKHHHKHSHHW